MTTFMWLGIVTIELALQVFFGRAYGPTCRRLIQIQAVYSLLSFVGRPLLQLLIQPSPRLNDSLADPRLAFLGYDQGLSKMAAIVAVGQLGILATIFVCRSMLPLDLRIAPSPLFGAFVGAYALSWGFRGMFVAHALPSAMGSFVFCSSLFAGGLAILTDWRATGTRRLVCVAVFFGELFWSILFESKTPILGFLAAILVGFSGRVRINGRLLAIGIVSLPLVLVLFVQLQTVKLSDEDRAALSSVNAVYPGPIRWALPVARRLDLSSAVLDAALAREQSLRPSSLGWKIARAVVPQQLIGQKQASSGTDWAKEVRAATIHGGTDTVSLADGPVAEGYWIGGYLGTVLECAMSMLLTILIGRFLVISNMFFRLYSIYFVVQPVLLERGLLGILENLSKGAQVSLVSLAIFVVSSHFVGAGSWRSTMNSRTIRLPSPGVRAMPSHVDGR